VSQRTAIINQIRAFLLERGTVFAEKPAKLKVAMADVLENADNALTPMMGNLIDILWNEWSTVEEQIDELTDRLEQIAANDAGCCRIRQIQALPHRLRRYPARPEAHFVDPVLHMARAFYSRFGISVRREFPDNGSCYKDWRSAKPCAWLISNTASPSLTPRAPTERQSASSRE